MTRHIVIFEDLIPRGIKSWLITGCDQVTCCSSEHSRVRSGSGRAHLSLIEAKVAGAGQKAKLMEGSLQSGEQRRSVFGNLQVTWDGCVTAEDVVKSQRPDWEGLFERSVFFYEMVGGN